MKLAPKASVFFTVSCSIVWGEGGGGVVDVCGQQSDGDHATSTDGGGGHRGEGDFNNINRTAGIHVCGNQLNTQSIP